MRLGSAAALALALALAGLQRRLRGGQPPPVILLISVDQRRGAGSTRTCATAQDSTFVCEDEVEVAVAVRTKNPNAASSRAPSATSSCSSYEVRYFRDRTAGATEGVDVPYRITGNLTAAVAADGGRRDVPVRGGEAPGEARAAAQQHLPGAQIAHHVRRGHAVRRDASRGAACPPAAGCRSTSPTTGTRTPAAPPEARRSGHAHANCRAGGTGRLRRRGWRSGCSCRERAAASTRWTSRTLAGPSDTGVSARAHRPARRPERGRRERSRVVQLVLRDRQGPAAERPRRCSSSTNGDGVLAPSAASTYVGPCRPAS